mmetsp:Transcript_37883/g.94938  ORF Transcript_37883/g.94938 Transcript_37883/m.94938 type:complete len:135 (-) Transcript_37883:276-680(-)
MNRKLSTHIYTDHSLAKRADRGRYKQSQTVCLTDKSQFKREERPQPLCLPLARLDNDVRLEIRQTDGRDCCAAGERGALILSTTTLEWERLARICRRPSIIQHRHASADRHTSRVQQIHIAVVRRPQSLLVAAP